MVANKGERTGSWLAAAAECRVFCRLMRLWAVETDTTDINWCKWLWRIYGRAAGLRRRTGWGAGGGGGGLCLISEGKFFL